MRKINIKAQLRKLYCIDSFGALMIVGACIGSFSDSFIEIRTDVVLNNMFPSEQRATLMSINSFTFSVVMIVLSPIFGWIFK